MLDVAEKQEIEISVESIVEPAEENEVSDPLKNELLLKEMLEAIEHLNELQKICIRKCYLEKKPTRQFRQKPDLLCFR